MSLPPQLPRVDWQPTPVSQLPSWSGARRVAVDVETRDPQLKTLGIGVRRGGYMVGVSFAIEDGPAHYLPIAHEGGGNLPREHVLAYLRDQALNFRGDVCGANMQYDLDYLAEQDIYFPAKRFFRDVQIADPLTYDLHDSYSLENIARRRGLPGKSEDQLRAAAACYGVDPKAGLWQIPARFVGPYGEQDARLPLQLLAIQERELMEQDLWGVYDLESKLLPVLLKMRRRGVRINFDKLERIEQWSHEEEAKSLAELTRLTGVRLGVEDTNRTAVMGPLLKSAGIVLPKTAPSKNFPEGQDSLKKDVLDKFDHPIAKHIVRARKFRKLRDTFVHSIREHAVNGRIHATFNQMRTPREDDSDMDDEQGARYGRLSCVDPALQQQPARDKEIAALWRAIYEPDDVLWVCGDYSQQEPRWLTHFAAVSGCTGAAAARQRYIENPMTDNHDMMAQITGTPRDEAKTIYLGLCYGMGSAKLARKTNKPTKMIPHWKTGALIEVAGDEAEAMLHQFNSGAPYVKELADRAMASAKRKGYIRTVSGRRCRFAKGPDGKYQFTHKGLNRLIQGSSGDQTKTAMVIADEAGHALQIQMHDELDESVGTIDKAKELAEIMRTALPSTVPFRIDLEVGDSWGTLQKVES